MTEEILDHNYSLPRRRHPVVALRRLGAHFDTPNSAVKNPAEKQIIQESDAYLKFVDTCSNFKNKVASEGSSNSVMIDRLEDLMAQADALETSLQVNPRYTNEEVQKEWNKLYEKWYELYREATAHQTTETNTKHRHQPFQIRQILSKLFFHNQQPQTR